MFLTVELDLLNQQKKEGGRGTAWKVRGWCLMRRRLRYEYCGGGKKRRRQTRKNKKSNRKRKQNKRKTLRKTRRRRRR